VFLNQYSEDIDSLKTQIGAGKWLKDVRITHEQIAYLLMRRFELECRDIEPSYLPCESLGCCCLRRAYRRLLRICAVLWNW